MLLFGITCLRSSILIGAAMSEDNNTTEVKSSSWSTDMIRVTVFPLKDVKLDPNNWWDKLVGEPPVADNGVLPFGVKARMLPARLVLGKVDSRLSGGCLRHKKGCLQRHRRSWPKRASHFRHEALWGHFPLHTPPAGLH